MTRALKTTLVLGALCGALAVPAVIHAQGDHGWGRREFGMRGPFDPGVLRRLDLTDAQREQIRAVYEQHRDELRTLGERLRTAHRAQSEAVNSIPVNEEQIRARSAEVAAAQTEMALLRARIHAAVYQVLTPEQQSKAQQLRGDRQKRFEERRQRREQHRQQRQQAQPDVR
jgi:periplasmic protein CpxP/Spy